MNSLEPIKCQEPLPIVKEESTSEANQNTENEEEKIVPFPVLTSIKEKLNIKPFPWKIINAKNGIIAACLALIAVAGYLNIRYGLTDTKDPAVVPETSIEETENYFQTAVIDRERIRDEALEVLVSITSDETADSSARDSAYEQMEKIANQTSWEINIENLIKAKGFEECIAVINDDSANIVVKSDGLSAGEVAQIKEIVYLESDIQPKNIKIIEKN